MLPFISLSKPWLLQVLQTKNDRQLLDDRILGESFLSFISEQWMDGKGVSSLSSFSRSAVLRFTDEQTMDASKNETTSSHTG